MGSSIDALIAGAGLGPSLLDQQQQQAGIAHVNAATAAQQAATQGEAFKNRAIEREMADQDVIRRAFVNTDRSPKAMQDYIIRNGISGNGFQNFNMGLLDVQKKSMGLQKDAFEVESQVHSRVGNVLQAVRAAPPEERAQRWIEAQPLLKQLEPNGPWGDQTPSDSDLDYQLGVHDFAGKALAQRKAQLDLEHTSAATAQTQQETEQKAELHPFAVQKAQNDALISGLDTDARLHPDDAEKQVLALTPKDRAEMKIRAEQIAKLNTPAELAFKASDPNAAPEVREAAKEALKILEHHAIASRPITNVMGVPGLGQSGTTTGEEFLSSLPPGTAAQVKAIAEGKSALPPLGTRGSGAQIRDAVFRYDPSFNEQRAQIRRAFTTGTDGRNIGALNTATVHLDQFAEAAKAMGNGSFRPGNEVYNRLKTAFGESTVTNLESLKSAVAGEMAAALKGNATDVEIHNVASTIKSANSPKQLADAVKTNLHVLAAKLKTYQERYQQQSPDDTTWSPVLPSARKVYEKHGVAESNPSGPKAATHRYNPQTGKIEAIQ